MKKNVGTVDGLIRVILAIITIFLFYNKILTDSLFMIIAVILLLTSLTGFCPLYSLLGLKTKHEAPKEPARG
ncbi:MULTISPECIES: DUF2892 domain-containing protein [unclassified Chitinophaga]|uniref:YgaP family membrane protein n=1 Tax=unclassified Chitinophaga TaxID=2619133 RepID=UPI0009CFCBBD|nr:MULTISPECIES: DUF2892 domain-containing protein [unclassified Chitinophaga]OMP78611.1 hypothetical protein BW716_14130 [[Flexibacter] sp. ATCC 35208]WPV64777.1 DUF2892 domain-containing protein [Chitinophaga sp. LS1]